MRKSLLNINKRMLSTSNAIRHLCLLALLIGNFFQSLCLVAKEETSHFSNLKATFIVNTLNYIRWQDKDLPLANKNFEFLIVGDDKNNIAGRLSYLISETGFKIKNRPLKVHQVPSLNEAESQIGIEGKKIVLLLDSELSAWENEKYPNISGTLLMGESSKFLRRGLVLTFRKENNRLKLGVNLKKANAMNLTISSKLLSLNRIVYQESSD